MQVINEKGSDHIKELELKIKTQDERISALLDSNNDLTLALTQKDQTIQKFDNKIKALKEGDLACIPGIENQARCLINKINCQITSYESTFKGKEYLVNYRADMNYIESLEVTTETEIKNLVELEEFSVISTKLKSMLSQFHTEKSENEIKIFKENISSESKNTPLPTESIVDSETACHTACVDQNVSTQHVSIKQVHNDIFAQLESKVKATLNVELDAAIKKSTKSFAKLQVTSQRPDQGQIEELGKKLENKDNLIADLSKRFTEVQTGLGKQISDERSKIQSLNAKNTEAQRKLRYETSDKNIALLKVKELETKLNESGKKLKSKESEISQLAKRISNQTKDNSLKNQAMNLKCKEIETLQKEVKKLSGKQTSQAEVNKLKTKISQLEADLRLQKSLATTAQKSQSEIEKLKNELVTVKKSHASTMSTLQSKLQKQLNQKELEISKLKKSIAGIGNLQADLQKKLREYESEISRLNNEIIKKENIRTLQMESEWPSLNGPSKPAGKYIIPQKQKGDGETNAEYEMLLSEKDAIIAEYLSEINRKDEEKSERISCPVCFDEISENRKWTAFHNCGHRTCCNCFKSLASNSEGKKHCPICGSVISVSVTLEGIY